MADKIDPTFIDSPEGAPDWNRWDDRLRRIVIGQLELEKGKQPPTIDELPEDLAERFPKLTHLYVWGVGGLKRLPNLPANLECLDVRNCPKLAQAPLLPSARLRTLVLEECSALSDTLTKPADYPLLDDLSLKACPQFSEGSVLDLIAASHGLRRLDLSDCPQLSRIRDWPPDLVDLRLNGCAGLRALPHRWPRQLRRLELRGVTGVTKLPDFPSTLDYIDLGRTHFLRQLPQNWGRPRTLFLFGSGVLMPPASEHGASGDENVAARTRAYFEDVDLTGQGEVKRCKLLMLGNGAAGKTCLSLALVPGEDPARADQLGTTHAVQFWDWDFKANTGGSIEPVHLHLWDFGGQEIYHNTHRLFMSTGAVFVVVWKPDQDGAKAPRDANGYEDEWRPLRYWLDLIHDACPHKPRIAVVCSHHDAPSPELTARWKAQAGSHADECRCFFIDSRNERGQLSDLQAWLEDEVGQVVATQGTAVPAYWEIAQDMVSDWVRRLDSEAGFAVEHNQMHPHRFREALYQRVRSAISTDREGRYDQLRGAIERREFELTDDRLRRTLEFLTHSGWVYWDARLHEERVIVGQKWALDGMYTILDRRPDSAIYKMLNRSDGRFTASQLAEWAWDAAGYSETDQELFLSFMLRCGLCFRLRKGPEAWREEDVYVSFEHLPTAKELRLQRAFDSRLADLNLEDATLSVPGLHKHHWQSFLSSAGNHYGKDARYALDGFYLENEQGEKILILCDVDESGLSGEIDIKVGSGKARERLKAVEEHLRRFLPGVDAAPPGDPSEALGKRTQIEEVFISYAWDPPAKEGETGIPPGYEVPVDAVEQFLRDKPIRLIRDKSATRFGDNLKHFMEYGAKRPHVVVVHSDKYWRSPYCIFELWTVVHELQQQQGRSLLSVVIPIEHLSSGITTERGLEGVIEYWRAVDDSPAMIEWRADELRDYAAALLRTFSRDLAQHLSLNVRWDDGERAVMNELARRLNLALPKSDD
jgi:internalin A